MAGDYVNIVDCNEPVDIFCGQTCRGNYEFVCCGVYCNSRGVIFL